MRIIPAPKKITYLDGEFVFTEKTTLKCVVANIRDNLNAFLFKTYGFSLKEGNDIVFFIDDALTLSDEGYVLEIDDIVKISAKTEKGLFYGMQSLKQLVAEHYRNDKRVAVIQKLLIEDEPRFSYRGFMLDCCRHFFDIETVKRFIQAISLFKFNVFHWHLSDDQGWRVEVPAFSKLTEVGSRRDETMGDGKPVEGFFTKEQIAEVVKFAADRYVTVIPEFDMPGHTRAAIAAYPELACSGAPTKVSTKFGIHPEILCGGRDETYSFIYSILSAYAKTFPSPYIHIGGDEAIKTQWYTCEKCQNKIKQLGLKNEEELQAYMTNTAINHLKTLDKTAICWNECANSGTLDDSAVLQFWNDGKTSDNVVREVKSGRKIIVSKFNPYYVDYPFAMHSLKACYEFEPVFPEIADYESNVLGVESPLWTEYVDNVDLLSYRAFPRILAVAESGWSDKDDKNYESFVSALPLSDVMLESCGLKNAPLKDCNPGPFKKVATMIKFGIQMIDIEMISRSIKANKEMKKMREVRKGDTKND